jgi:hypothetical protein
MQQNDTKILVEIINIQGAYYDKFGVGYKQTHTKKGLSSITMEREAKQKSYVDLINGSINKEECKPTKKSIWKQ